MQCHCIYIAFEGGVKGIIVKGIIVILWSRISLMCPIYSLHWASIQSSIQPSIIPNKLEYGGAVLPLQAEFFCDLIHHMN
jgi:hypothetical protein